MAEQITRYLKGVLSEEERRELERKLEEHPFWKTIWNRPWPGPFRRRKWYFEELGDGVNDIDYGGAVQDLYYATKGKMSDDAHRQAMAWIVKALQFPEVTIMNKVNLLTMLGDSHRTLKEYKEARECYNQVFMEGMQITQKMTKAAVQMKIKQKLAALELLKK